MARPRWRLGSRCVDDLCLAEHDHHLTLVCRINFDLHWVAHPPGGTPCPSPTSCSRTTRSTPRASTARSPSRPSKHIAVLACMDARLNVYGVLGLEEGEAHVIRNAGGVVTDDEIRSLAISQRLLGTKEIVLIHHTDCGMLTFTDEEFADSSLEADTGERAGLGVGSLRRPRRRRAQLDRADQGEPVHPAHRPGPRVRVRRRHRSAARGRLGGASESAPSRAGFRADLARRRCEGGPEARRVADNAARSDAKARAAGASDLGDAP